MPFRQTENANWLVGQVTFKMIPRASWLCLCFTSVAVFELQALLLLQRHTACEIICWMSLVSGICCRLVGMAKPMSELSLHETLLFSAINTVALYCLFTAVTCSDIPTSLGLKASEPMFALLVNSGLGVRCLRFCGFNVCNGPKCLNRFVVTSVVVICIGSYLCSTGGNFTSNVNWQALVWMGLSNALLAARTTIQKSLIDVSGEVVSSTCELFWRAGLASALLCSVPALLAGRANWRLDDVCLIFGTGLSYASYQLSNTKVLDYTSPVTYSVLKQARVVGMYLLSAYFYSHVTLASLIGAVLAIAGGVMFSRHWKDRRTLPKSFVV